MKRTLLALSLLSLMTTSYALNIEHGKLIKHKEWTTGNHIQSYITKDLALNPKAFSTRQLAHVKTDPNMDVIILNSHIYNIEAPVSTNTDVELMGFNNGVIYNNTSAAQLYDVTSSICIETYRDSDPGVCYYSSDTFVLDPQGAMQMNRRPTMTYQFRDAVPYYVSVGINAQRNNSTVFATSDGMVVYAE